MLYIVGLFHTNMQILKSYEDVRTEHCSFKYAFVF